MDSERPRKKDGKKESVSKCENVFITEGEKKLQKICLIRQAWISTC